DPDGSGHWHRADRRAARTAGGLWRSREAARKCPALPIAPGCPAHAWAGRRASGIPLPADGGWLCNPGSRGSSQSVFGKDATRLFGVAVHLLGQRRQIVELFFIAQLGDKFDFDVAAVKVALE